MGEESEGKSFEVSTGKEGIIKMQTPNGYNELVATFGDIHQYIDANGHIDEVRWRQDYLAYAQLPFSIPLSWDSTKSVQKILCHKLLVPIVEPVFEFIEQLGLQTAVTSYGGCYNFRPQRTGAKLSTHSWGIAIDLNPNTNQQGTVGNMNSRIVMIFKAAGFEWGGDWPLPHKDPMHFQFVTGY